MNKKYYKLNEDRWELPDFDEYKGKKRIGPNINDYDPNYSDLEWEDFDNSDINWSGMNYRTKEERKRDDDIISGLKIFYDNTKYVTGNDKLKEDEVYARLSFPRWSTKTKKYYKKIFEDYYYYYGIEIDLNKDNTDEIRRLIKYYPEYNPSKYLFVFYDYFDKMKELSESLSCIIEGLSMHYNGKELIPGSKYLWWNGDYIRTFKRIVKNNLL